MNSESARRHWFQSVLYLVLGLWVMTLVFFMMGTQSVRLSSGGAGATIELHDKHKRPMVLLAPRLGLEVDDYVGLRGSVVKLKPTPIVCRMCGSMRYDGFTLVEATHRDGDWLYHAAKEDTLEPSWPQKMKDSIRTVAYNIATKESVMVSEKLGVEEQKRALAAHNLVADQAHAFTTAMIASYTPVTMQEENCIVFNAAFACLVLLWLLIGGPIALLTARKQATRV